MSNNLDQLGTDELLRLIAERKAQRELIDADIRTAEEIVRKRVGGLAPATPPYVPYPPIYPGPCIPTPREQWGSPIIWSSWLAGAGGDFGGGNTKTGAVT